MISQPLIFQGLIAKVSGRHMILGKGSVLFRRLLILALFAVATAFLTGGCGTSPSGTGGSDATLTDLTAEQTNQLIQEKAGDPNFAILDVRTSTEFTAGHLSGATNLNYNSPNFRNDLEALDKNKAYLVYCGSGSRSASACAVMKDAGFKELYNLLSGLAAWRAQGYPVVQ
jgi:rhodanese-related sulfurtransferase